MSYCREEGKDTIVFLTPEDAVRKDKEIVFENSDGTEDQRPGLITSSGEINWNCPCLGGMAIGPCGVEFREAFSCFHYSEAEPKGSDCLEKFNEMQDCMKEHPLLYSEHNKSSMPDEEQGSSEAPGKVENDGA